MPRRTLIASALVLAIVPAYSVSAQSTSTAASSSADEIPSAAVTLDRMVVTAQHREQATLDVPFALTALDQHSLEKLGIATLRDLSLYTPGLLVEDQSPNNPIFVMRGITSSGGDSFTEPRVSIFQDGVPISKSRGSFVELFDIDRVEVAKGPQSTLFGRGALIGGINVIQNRARPDLDWSAGVEAGNHGQRRFDGMLNLPLSESVALRVAARRREHDGYVPNLDPEAHGDLNGLDLGAYRATLSVDTGGPLRADLILNHQSERTDGTGFKSMYQQQTDPRTGEPLAGTRLDEGIWLQPPTDFTGGRGLGVDQEYSGATLLLDYRINDDFKLAGTTGYREVDSIEVYDPDGISLPVFTSMEDIGGTYFSQELRLNYDGGGRFSAFAGLNYYRERARAQVDVRFDERMLLAQAAGMLHGGPALGRPADHPAPAGLFENPAFTGALVQGMLAQLSRGHLMLPMDQAMALAARMSPGYVETSRNTSDLDAYDLFADVTFRPNAQWELSAGLRYTDDDKTTAWSSSVQQRSVVGGLLVSGALAASGTPQAMATAQQLLAGLTAFGGDLSAPLPAFGINAQPTANNGDWNSQDLGDDGLTWRLAARFQPRDGLNLFANYARGRRAAVLSATSAGMGNPGGAAQFTVAPAETLDAFEVGLKAEAAGGRLRTDASAFYYAYENFQTREMVGSGFVTTNAGEAEAYGIETQLNWRAADNVDLFGNYAYTHARLTTGAYEGNRFARSPDHMLSLGLSWRLRGWSGEFDLRPSYSYRSKIFFSDDNDRSELQSGAIVPDLIQDEYQDAFGLWNLAVGYTPDSGRWQLEAFATNLTDTLYRKGAGSAGKSIGLPTNVMGTPRFVGLRFAIRY